MSLSLMKIEILNIIKVSTMLVFAAFFLTGCVAETINRNRADATLPFDSFLQHSLGEYEIARQRSVSRTELRNTSFFVERIRIRGTEWTLAYTDHTGQERRLAIDNLSSPTQSPSQLFAEQRFASVVLEHAEATIEGQAMELLNEHFTDREIRDFQISIEIERVGHFDVRESNLIDAETGISLVNLTPQELFSFQRYNVIIDTRVPTEDLRESPELRARFEDLLYDVIAHFEDESLVLSFGNLTILRYNARLGELVWNERLRFD